MGVQNILKEKRADILRIAELRGARKIRVFGSAAKGEAGPDSDVDLLVEFDEKVTLLQHNALIRELGDLLGCKVDVVSDRALRPKVRDRVLGEAIPL
jgi:hypothetical protein